MNCSPSLCDRTVLARLMSEAGASRWGCAGATPVDSRVADERARWLAEGRHGSMQWLELYDDIRRDPSLLLPGARTVVMAAFSYHTRRTQPAEAPQIARYALGRDYHEVVRQRLNAVAEGLGEAFGPGAAFRICVDTAPLPERYWAVRAGVGFTGLNSQLIVPGSGSHFFLGAIVTTLAFEPDASLGERSCGNCRRCVAACPGGAIGPKGEFDARRCLSYLTIENRGPIPPGTAVGNRLYGCDECQRVCPHNAGAANAPALPEFEPREELLALTLDDVLAMTQADFSRIFSHSAVKRAKLAGLQRNAAFLAASRAHDADSQSNLS